MRLPATDDPLLSRIRGEFLEMPGLRLTAAQARRLWDIDVETCDRILAALVQSQFLQHDRDGRYVRSRDRSDAVLPVRMVKAGIPRSRHQRTGH
jgi:hypothetical protein